MIKKGVACAKELESRDAEELRRGEPTEELEKVSFGRLEQNRTVKIGAAAPEMLKEE